MARTVLVALATVGVGIAAFVASDWLPPREYVLTFSDEQESPKFTTIQGITFSLADGHLTITEPLAHLRLPFKNSALGKNFVLRARFRVDAADTIAVGVKKGSFWLDYERQSLFSSTANQRQGNTAWIEEERTFDLSSAYLTPDGSLELMLFINPVRGSISNGVKPEEQPRVVVDEIRLRIEPGLPNVSTLARRIRQQLAQRIRRPPVQSRTP